MINQKLLCRAGIASYQGAFSSQLASIFNWPRKFATNTTLKQTAMVALLVTGFSLSNLSLAENYTFIDLGETLGGNESVANAINNAGLVTGSISNLAANTSTAVLWNGGDVTYLGTLGGTGGFGYAINDAGVVVGSAFTANNTAYHATQWNGITATDLGTLGGTNSQATAINNAGLVVGSSTTDNNNYFHATLWNETTATDLGTLGGNYSQATAINDAGLVAGYAYTTIDTTFRHATIWNSSGVTDLGTLGGDYSEATAINDAGQVVGFSYLAGNAIRHASLWNGTTVTDLGTLGGLNSVANDINNAGQIVGSSNILNDGGEFYIPADLYHAALWQDSSVTDLNNFLDANTVSAGWVLTMALGINDNGWIVGSATNSVLGIRSRPFLLIPPVSIPLPAAIWLFCSGLICLTALTRSSAVITLSCSPNTCHSVESQDT
ncbi:MAG: hypothetical protein Q7U98_01095 [Methylicorpusculum sp.]|uniref:hypothetical protein n=1 Tax=Methylicorpusculum sp. TaxID=2713644 RepID=UPI00271D83F4|nr:hypothetical protein [Methylicorpusculum sp.]MDO8937736.1 hypothetical protein [Methylicorpusculum sp.]